MKLTPSDAAIEYYKFQSARYRFLFLGSVAALLFIFQNSTFGGGLGDSRPNFLFSIVLLVFCVFFSFAAYMGLTSLTAKLMRLKAVGSVEEVNLQKSHKWDIRFYWIARQTFQFGMVGVFIEYIHFWLLQKTDWYLELVSGIPWA